LELISRCPSCLKEVGSDNKILSIFDFKDKVVEKGLYSKLAGCHSPYWRTWTCCDKKDYLRNLPYFASLCYGVYSVGLSCPSSSCSCGSHSGKLGNLFERMWYESPDYSRRSQGKLLQTEVYRKNCHGLER